MSSDGDVLAFQNSMNDNLADANTVLFNDKNYTYITDSTSNSGSFSSGQIQFDLTTLNSQSQWINLSEAVIEFPVKITAQVTTVAAGASGETNAKAFINSAIIKNGWHQWIDSCQVIVNGQTIQSAQPWENVAAQFRILSTWSQDELVKNGSTYGIALDDCTASSGQTDLVLTNTKGLANATYATVAPVATGYDAVNNQDTLYNKGVSTRATFTNNEIALTTNMQTKILGATSMKTAGRNNVGCLAAGSAATSGTGIYLYSAFYMASVRFKDICDIKDFPLCKNLKGFVYLSFNSSSIALSSTLSGGVGSATVSNVAIQSMTGHTTPFLINTQATTGITPGFFTTTATAAGVVTVVGSVDATTTGIPAGISGPGPLLTNARMLVPYYIANPKADAALSQSNKFFTTMEKIINPITLVAGGTINYTITTGVPNARRLVLLPMWQNLGQTTPSTATLLTNPELSPFDTVPATSGPFAGLQNLQVYLGNKPVYQYPINYDFEQWVEEQSQLGLNGDAINESTSGLLSQQLWEQNHRFYSIDLSRRMDSENGSSKSVQVSFTNPSSTFGMKVIAIIFYEKRWFMNTSQCQLMSA